MNLSTDIHVEAFVRDRRILQLNVTLLKSMNSVYDVFISTVDNKPNSSRHCEALNHCRIIGIPQVMNKAFCQLFNRH